jgi:hypothetical protein
LSIAARTKYQNPNKPFIISQHYLALYIRLFWQTREVQHAKEISLKNKATIQSE